MKRCEVPFQNGLTSVNQMHDGVPINWVHGQLVTRPRQDLAGQTVQAEIRALPMAASRQQRIGESRSLNCW